jgi:hypothetical protein
MASQKDSDGSRHGPEVDALLVQMRIDAALREEITRRAELMTEELIKEYFPDSQDAKREEIADQILTFRNEFVRIRQRHGHRDMFVDSSSMRYIDRCLDFALSNIIQDPILLCAFIGEHTSLLTYQVLPNDKNRSSMNRLLIHSLLGWAIVLTTEVLASPSNKDTIRILLELGADPFGSEFKGFPIAVAIDNRHGKAALQLLAHPSYPLRDGLPKTQISKNPTRSMVQGVIAVFYMVVKGDRISTKNWIPTDCLRAVRSLLLVL